MLKVFTVSMLIISEQMSPETVSNY